MSQVTKCMITTMALWNKHASLPHKNFHSCSRHGRSNINLKIICETMKLQTCEDLFK